MDNTNFGRKTNSMIGIPYKNINWEDIPGQPFGLASQFNLFILGDANNIVDVEGAVAIGGSFYSTRGLSVGFEREKGQMPIEFSPDLVRYLIGNTTSMKGPLVVTGHAVSGGSLHAEPGNTYFIGKNNSADQMDELKSLYEANGGSPYWMPSDKGIYYIISSYDVQRIIPASRIAANLPVFFGDAKESIEDFKTCIEELNDNGTVSSNSYEWILSGNNSTQNIFTIDTRPNGLINKGIRFDIPEGSVAIVRLRTGPHAHLQYGVYGEENLANRILYVFEDATNIHMEKSSDIWGSILAPQATFHGNSTGGHVSGNAVLGGFAVNANSGFEFHLYPFVGGVICGTPLPMPETVPSGVSPEVITNPEEEIGPTCPEVVPCPTCPEAAPCPTCPEAKPCPTCPEVMPCPEAAPCPTCPEARPCPTCPVCPEPRPCPTCPVCPEARPCPTCPEVQPCPVCPVCPICPEPKPCPTCPVCPICPECPTCPEREAEYVAIPIPVPIKTVPVRPVCEKCLIKQGVIIGCILGCDCCRNHDWDVMLYRMVDGRKKLMECITICHFGCFQFEVDYEGYYILKVCPIKRNCFSPSCKPEITFKNVGVANFTIE